MVYTKPLAAIAAASLFARLAVAFDAQSESNVVVYYGQGYNQPRLSQICQETSLDIINIGFVNVFPDVGEGGWPGSNFGNQCNGQTYTNADGEATQLLSGCQQIADDIPVCQQAGKKVFISLGGAYPADGQVIDNDDSARDFADFLWGAFGPETDAWVAQNGPRPFGDAVVDGFDFDIEHNGPTGYAALARRLRDNFSEFPSKQFYLSAAPQCLSPDAQLSNAIQFASFDFIWVQFYNTDPCSARAWVDGDVTSDFTFDAWIPAIKLGGNPSAKLFIGLPADPTQAYYVSPDEVETLVEEYMGRYPENFGGIMIWEATASDENQIDGRSYAANMKSVLLKYAPPVATPTPPAATPTPPVSSSAISSSKPTPSGASSGQLTSSAIISGKPTPSGASSGQLTSSVIPSSKPTPSAQSTFSSIVSGKPTPSGQATASGKPTPSGQATPSGKPISSGQAVSSGNPASSGIPYGKPTPTGTPVSGKATPSGKPASTASIISTSKSSSSAPVTVSGPALSVATSATRSSSGSGLSFSGSSSVAALPSFFSATMSHISPSASVIRSTTTGQMDPSITPNAGVSSAASGYTSSSSGLATITTVIVTSYIDICPTGFTTITTTYTTYYCPGTVSATTTPAALPTGSSSQTTTPQLPEGWSTTVTVCTQCAATPTTVTLTKPLTATSINVITATATEVASASTSGSSGNSGNSGSTAVSGEGATSSSQLPGSIATALPAGPSQPAPVAGSSGSEGEDISSSSRVVTASVVLASPSGVAITPGQSGAANEEVASTGPALTTVPVIPVKGSNIPVPTGTGSHQTTFSFKPSVPVSRVPVSPSSTQGSVAPVFTGAAGRASATSWLVAILAVAASALSLM
ncbi:CAZyme family GH18 [Paecilomyces variotii]|nr:CAZyme family GH18 [Paecilomyces variotii]